MTSHFPCAAGLALLCAQSAAAAVHCVATPADLTAALLAAQQNTAGSDEVRLRTGRYLAPDGGWRVDVQQRGIDIEGGYTDATCQTRTLDASATVLDGHGAVRPLTVDTSFSPQSPSGITVRALTFENGVDGVAAGLKLSDSGPIYNGTMLIEGNVFRNNGATVFQQDNSGGALSAATDGNGLTVRNNLFVGNRANDGSAAALFSNNAIDVIGNTVTGNQSFDTTLATRATFTIFTFSKITYSNNVFWANNPDNLGATFDLRATNPFGASLAADLFNNDLQAVSGTPGTQQGNLAIDPHFVDAANGNFRLGSGSLLIDAGTDTPHGGASAVDLDGHPRVQGLHADIGAYEGDIVFRNGFE